MALSQTLRKTVFIGAMYSFAVFSGPLYATWDLDQEGWGRHVFEPAMENAPEPHDNTELRDRMIKESIAKHGFCACPYSTDALGRQCGTLCAYYDPWRDVKCYRRDISNEEAYFYRLKNALNSFMAQEEKQEAEEEAKDEAEGKTKSEKKDPTADYFRNGATPPASPAATYKPANQGSTNLTVPAYPYTPTQ